MSSYVGKAVNPLTGLVEDVCFLDDCYGRHKYGVKFSDGHTYPESEIEYPPTINKDSPEDAIDTRN